MNYIESVKIEGLWGACDISLNFDNNVNFLIGKNGTGKTTVINLIATALSADLESLDRILFDTIEIKLAEFNGKRKPSVVIKKEDVESQFPKINYYIRDKASSEAVEYPLDDLEERFMYRKFNLRISKRIRNKRKNSSILEHLNQLVNLAWLSVHRASKNYVNEERIKESSVDQKLDQLLNSFIRYSSKLTKKSDLLMSKFQETIFLSLLADQSEDEILDQIKSKFDFKEERNALEEIYKKFELNPNQFEMRTSKHFEELKNAIDKMNNKNASGLSLTEFAAIMGTIRIKSVIDQWRDLTKQQDEIFKSRNTFLEILNSMVSKKEFFINNENVLSVKNEKKQDFPVQRLSSGEKQLLIILGEALLQERKPWIYIADEPEISLHVEWQESLVQNILAINPNAQIVFATHSPDIVSKYNNSLIDMETFFK